LDYSESTMELAKSYDKTLNEFFLLVKHILRTTPSHGVESFQKWTPAEVALNEQLIKCTENVHNALCDNIDTRKVLESIRDLVNVGNSYIQNNESRNRVLLKKTATYMTRIFNILGLNAKPEEIGFTSSTESAGNMEEAVMPYLTALADFRDSVRKEAIPIKASNILKTCDDLRDNVLPELGVRLEDKENEPTVIKLVDKNELLREKEEKKMAEEKKKAEKAKKKAEAEAKQAELDAKKRINPSEMFKSETDKYSKFDEKGIPTHNAKGEEVPKSQIKKLQKLYAKQEETYKKFQSES